MLVTDDCAFLLLKSFQDQLECYQQLLSMSKTQSEYISSSQEKQLLELIKTKESLIKKVGAISNEMQEEKALLEKTPLGEFSQFDEELDQVLKAIEDTLKDLVETESKDMEVLEDYQKSHNQKMELLGRGKNVAKAYFGNKGQYSMNKKV